MKRRELKKSVHSMTNELLAECLCIRQTLPNVPVEDIKNLVDSILIMQDEYIARLSHVDSRQTKAFFRQFRADIINQANELADQIASLA